MIRTQSDDPNIKKAANQASDIIRDTLAKLPVAESYDYGGHIIKIGEYNVCRQCATSIAESQQAYRAIALRNNNITDPVIKEHLEIAMNFLRLSAETSIIRAKLHNGQGTEGILNELLTYNYNRKVDDTYSHSHDYKKG